MKSNLLSFILAVILMLALIWSSCTDNQRARNWGGTETIKLDPGVRLVNVTWKDQHLWILTKQDTTKPQTYKFKEKSSWGMVEGTVMIQEQ